MSGELRVLVVDDEVPIRRAVAHLLEPLNPRLHEATSGREALTIAAAIQPTLVVLDLGLPDMDGMEVCRELRKFSQAGVLVLTARDDDRSTVAALDAGADDFVTKPFSPEALRARVRALLRRTTTTGAPNAVVTAGDLVIRLAERVVERGGAHVHLTPTEWELLATLAAHAGRVMTHRQLFDTVWRGREFGDAQAHLRVHMAHLRRKLEHDPVRPRHLQTELGVGYRFVVA